MLYYLLYPLREFWFGFNVFKYITFRSVMAAVTAFVLSLALGPVVIAWLKRLNFGQNIRKDHVEPLYDLHKHKQGTPTMGGVLIVVVIALSTFLWSDIMNEYIMLTLGIFLFLGTLGFIDDRIKIARKRNLGLNGPDKFLMQALAGVFVALFIMKLTPIPCTLHIPFLKDLVIDLGVFYILFAVLVLAGSSNAVNLTDGLDGLAIGCTIIAALTYSVLSYICGSARFSGYLNIFFLDGAAELSVFCSAMVGAGLGFLWFNCLPASVFMGDTGSLALGGGIGVVALLIKKELLLFLVGGIFVMEALSVMLQIAYFRMTSKRLFLMSPIHHHFQLLGWPESKITARFWIVAIVLALVSLSTLKLQ